MIKKSVFEQDLINGMQRELQAHDKKQGMENLDKAADYLNSAIEILEEVGLTAKADEILMILAKIATKHHQSKEDTIEFKSLLKDIPKDIKPGDVIEFSNVMKKDKPKNEFTFESLLNDDQNAKSRIPKLNDPHTKGLTTEKMIKNLKEHGSMFNLVDDSNSGDLLNADIGEDPLEVSEDDEEKTFEDSD